MEVDDSSQQPFDLVGSGWTHLEVRFMPAHQGNYYSRRSQGMDDQVEPEAPIYFSYREPCGDTSDGAPLRPRPAPASSAAILGLKEVKASDASLQSECAVCLQDFEAEETLRAMPCSHAFHQRCISQ
ncbi:unnamed protein product [Urochloa humidicola]